MDRERIGLFGGTFNPVHMGHLKAAGEVLQRFSLERILFIPSHIPPHKVSREIASSFHRMKMVELALRGYPQFVASGVEVEREGTSYSVVTLGKIRSMFPGARIFFILGIDAFQEIETWRDYESVLEQCLFIVMTRPSYNLSEAKNVLHGRYKDTILEVAGSEPVSEEIFLTRRIFLLPIEALDISSSDIRRRIREGKSVAGLVPGAVEEYMKKNHLYRHV